MDLFLNQVAEYNAQQLSFDHQSVMDPNQLLTSQDVKAKATKNDEFIKPEPPNTKKGKQKSKENHSLLHVFTNPLLHAIPILARNCLNFEDFLAQTSLPGQNGLLGPQEDTEPEINLYSPPTTTPETPWHIRVLGLPHTGAKSRVETQIKICVQLVDSGGELTTNWSHLKLPEHMVAKDKLKRKNQKYGAEEKASLTDSQVLSLEAAVVCDSHPDNEIIMCTSCVHRERKRLKRKRDNKVARAANKEGGAAKLAALFANDLPDLSDEKVMAEERRRILLFNCNEYIEFNNGEATLPTRVTCYCRHHSEKVGFRVVFTMRDCSGHVIATGRSPPIMITDDHKSSKLQQAAARKRTRGEMDMSESDAAPPSTNKRKASAATTSMTNTELETDSGVSSPIASTPATPSSQMEDIPENSPKTSMAESSNTFNNNNNNIPISSSNLSTSHIPEKYAAAMENSNNNTGHFLSQLQASSSSSFDQHNIPQTDLFDFLNSNDLNLLSHSNNNTTNTHTHNINNNNNTMNNNNSHVAHSQQQPLSLVHPDHQQQQILSQFAQNPMGATLNRRRATVIGSGFNNQNNNNGMAFLQQQQQQQQQWQGNNNIYAKLQERNTLEGQKTPNLPRLHRLIPSEGPIYGGAEVTVLGSNFYEGLTCLFGENPAVPTHCWSANTLLCILPPAASAGPVVVSFKEHPLMLEGQDVVLFTYFDESDRALMELALQVVGLKTMGKVEDARQIAMRIVQGDNNNNNNSNNNNSDRKDHPQQQHQVGSTNRFRYTMSPLAATAVYDNARTLFLSHLEQHITASLIALSQGDRAHLSLTNENNHTLLHLATLCGYVHLAKTLVALGCDVNQRDKNGFTALHFASWTGKVEMVKVLLHFSDKSLINSTGKTAERLAIEANHQPIIQLFQATHLAVAKKKKKHIPFADFIPFDLLHLAQSILPARITDMVSHLYSFSAKTQSGQRLAHSAGQLYHFMLDPF
ncbi:hypothetical protein K501DRAFT_79973 [Backusella circina FSU 941]|nr:hypothetical protein K501DRAFT_79973 [Backusella circina FSU 941]